MKIVDLLGGQAEYYLNHTCKTIDKQLIHIPGPDMIDKVWMNSDRNIRTLESLQALYGHGRLANTGYVSILPVDQGIEHSAGASFAPNPLYFDPENIIKLAIEGGCNAVASTFGVLGAVARKYAHKIPFIVKLNHNELLTYPNSYDQVMFGTVKEAWNMGAVAVGATIYFGSEHPFVCFHIIQQHYATGRMLVTCPASKPLMRLHCSGSASSTASWVSMNSSSTALASKSTPIAAG